MTTATAASSAPISRAVDVTVSALALIVLVPIFVVVAIAIRLDSRGSVIFRQERVGRGGVPFRIHKFRSMRSAAGGPEVTVAGDARVTRVGAHLRQWKVDELPQLIDVLQGTMSLVGPRPEVPAYVALWPAGAREVILSVRPGITDPASVALRDESEILASVDDPGRYYTEVLLPQKVRLYVQYVQNRSVAGDLRVIGATVAAVLRRRPA